MNRRLLVALVPVLLAGWGCAKTGTLSGPLPPLKSAVPAKPLNPA